MPFTIEGHGYGFGTFEPESRPNVLRVFIGETPDLPIDEEVWVIEADMDDMETEYIGVVAAGGDVRPAPSTCFTSPSR